MNGGEQKNHSARQKSRFSGLPSPLRTWHRPGAEDWTTLGTWELAMSEQQPQTQPNRSVSTDHTADIETVAIDARELHTDASLSAAMAEVWKIAWPTVLTMTSYTVMQFVDKLMVGQVSPLDVAAQGNGGIWAFVPIAIAMGFLTVVNTYVSQNLGANTPEKGPRYAWGAVWLSLGAWLLVLLPVAAALPFVFQAMRGSLGDAEAINNGTVDRLIELQTTYGQILLVGAIFTIAGRGLHHYFFGMHWPKVVAVTAIIGNLANIAANYVLIFGENGLVLFAGEGGLPEIQLPGVPGIPAMGLTGAALGTVVGGFVEFIIPLAIFLGPKLHARYNTRSQWRPSLKPIKDLWKIGWPAAMQYGNELICWAIFMSLLVGSFGPDHTTAGWIALSYMHLSFMPAVGFSVAVTSLVGRYIGAGHPDTAVARARLGLSLALVYMTFCALVFFVLREPLVKFFIGGDVSPEQAQHIISIGVKLMICAAFFQTIDAVGIVYTGALRGAGDTVFPGIITMIYSWVFIVALGWALVAYMPQLESIGPWIGASVYIVIFGLTMGWRFESGRWRSINLVDDTESQGARQQPVGPGAPSTIPGGSVRDIAEDIVESMSD